MRGERCALHVATPLHMGQQHSAVIGVRHLSHQSLLHDLGHFARHLSLTVGDLLVLLNLEVVWLFLHLNASQGVLAPASIILKLVLPI